MGTRSGNPDSFWIFIWDLYANPNINMVILVIAEQWSACEEGRVIKGIEK